MSILECKGLSKRFGAVTALDGISFTIEPGRIVGLLGPNGSGKTTLIKLANGLLVPTAGELWINGRAPGKESHAMVDVYKRQVRFWPHRPCRRRNYLRMPSLAMIAR